MLRWLTVDFRARVWRETIGETSVSVFNTAIDRYQEVLTTVYKGQLSH